VSSIRAFDRAQEAFNLAKKQAVQEKVITFVMLKPKAGPYPLEIRFDYPGRISRVYASCTSAGSDQTVMQLEKCSQSDYDTTPVWTNVFASDLVLDANERSTATSSSPYVLADDQVNEGDHFRISFAEVGGGIGTVTVNVAVEI